MANEEQLAILRQGADAWNRWRKANPDEDIDLSGVNILTAELNGADLSKANLCGTVLLGAALGGADLRRANLSGASLDGANLGGASLRRANLTGANLNGADLSGACVMDVTYDRRAMSGCYGGIRVDGCYGDAIFKRDAQDQDFIDTLESRCCRRRDKVLFDLWRRTDHGRSIPSIVLFALNVVLLFGVIYMFFPDMLYHGNHPQSLFTPYYFSIVTYTTLGFGDVSAGGCWGEISVAVEVILGYVTLGLLLAILANKVARRS